MTLNETGDTGILNNAVNVQDESEKLINYDFLSLSIRTKNEWNSC